MNSKKIPGTNLLKLFVLSTCIMLCSFGGCKNNKLYVSPGNFYNPGKLSVRVISLEAGQQFNNPVQMDIYTPKKSFRYPVLIFQHGFTGSIKSYETILHQLASHGFVVVAPQMYPPGVDASATWPTPEEEAALGVQIISWVQENLNNIVRVQADTGLLGLCGHSRGGQIAYRMALLVPEKVAALAGVDPVDGMVVYGQEPAVNGALEFTFPTYVLGTGLGTIAAPFPCAPAEVGYQHFYDANPSPSWLAVATENGHADMIDEDVLCPNSSCNISCPGGPNRDGMRSFTAGTLAAFFSGTLQGHENAVSVLTDPDDAPVTCTMVKK
jgi:pimeloyl-ACP methyl ester carboxylesterase